MFLQERQIDELDETRIQLIRDQIAPLDAFERYVAVRSQLSEQPPASVKMQDAGSTKKAVLQAVFDVICFLREQLPGELTYKEHRIDAVLFGPVDDWVVVYGPRYGSGAMPSVKAVSRRAAIEAARAQIDKEFVRETS